MGGGGGEKGGMGGGGRMAVTETGKINTNVVSSWVLCLPHTPVISGRNTKLMGRKKKMKREEVATI